MYGFGANGEGNGIRVRGTAKEEFQFIFMFLPLRALHKAQSLITITYFSRAYLHQQTRSNVRVCMNRKLRLRRRRRRRRSRRHFIGTRVQLKL